MEQHYPVLFEQYALHEGSGGAGTQRGGFGLRYRVKLRRGEARASFVMDHGRTGPLGALGGDDGGVNQVSVTTNAVARTPLHLSKEQGIDMDRAIRLKCAPQGAADTEPPRLVHLRWLPATCSAAITRWPRPSAVTTCVSNLILWKSTLRGLRRCGLAQCLSDGIAARRAIRN